MDLEHAFDDTRRGDGAHADVELLLCCPKVGDDGIEVQRLLVQRALAGRVDEEVIQAVRAVGQVGEQKAPAPQ